MKRLAYVIPLGLALALTAALPASAANTPDQSNVPVEIRVPDGYTRVATTEGRGYQIYDCADGAWKFREPTADILDPLSREQIASHYAGPTWESTTDGSKVVGAVDARAEAPDPAGDIPWLLLKATDTSGTGVFDDVAYIQRLDTVGGAAPAGECLAGMTARIPYMSTYDFWAAKK